MIQFFVGDVNSEVLGVSILKRLFQKRARQLEGDDNTLSNTPHYFDVKTNFMQYHRQFANISVMVVKSAAWTVLKMAL